MKKFLVTYHAPASAMEGMKDMSPEDSKAAMAKWMEWSEKCGSGMIDLGSPIGKSTKISAAGTSNSERELNGYSIIQAENEDDALKMLEGHPHLIWHPEAQIELNPLQPIPGM